MFSSVQLIILNVVSNNSNVFLQAQLMEAMSLGGGVQGNVKEMEKANG